MTLLLIGLDAHTGAQPLLQQPSPSATAVTPSLTPDLTTTPVTPSPTCVPSATAVTPSLTPDLTTTPVSPSLTPDLTTTPVSPSLTPDLTTTASPTCVPSATTATPSVTTTAVTSSPTFEAAQLTPSISAAALSTNITPTAAPSETPTSSPSATATATSFPTRLPTPPETSTPIPTPSDGVTCAQGTEIAFTGEGPPRTALLLAFGQRIVGGGSTDAVGRFRIPLAVGDEKPGFYPVSVQVRGTKQVLRQWTCVVPEVTSTPTPAALIP